MQRFGRKYALKSLIEPTVLYVGLAGVLLYVMWPYVYYAKNEEIIVFGLFALWRYGWLSINFTRAYLYGRFAYPKLLHKIGLLDEKERYPDHIYFLIPSYKEEAWVSVETFKSIFNELLTIPSRATIVVATSGTPEEDSVIYQVYKSHLVRDKVELVFQHQREGKRIAMGHGMRAIARRYYKNANDYHSVTFFMDGDSYLEKGFFRKVLPHFAIDPKLGAVTTNEAAFIDTKSMWYKDWFNLKFGQRHLLFQSHSLSKKVLTLTGRLSAYRTDLIIRDEFIKRVENDIITTVMHGKFRFLMGDDKTTWYNLLKDGWHMRYLPDALCYSLESRDADFLELSRSLPYRWYGNTLRNSNRALALGPRKTGWFIWWAIFDQRISMWTSLVGIGGALVLGLFKAFFYFMFYIVWILLVRSIQIALIAYNGHLVSWRSLPLMLYGQWAGSLVKIKALFNLSDQKWSKGTETQRSDDSVAKISHPLVNIMPDLVMSMSYLLFIYVLLLSHDALAFPDSDLLKERAPMQPRITYESLAYGVIPDDGKDDAEAINALLSRCDGNEPCTITLPKGQIDLYHPIIIETSHVTLKGADETQSILISHLHTEDIAAIHIRGERGKKRGLLLESARHSRSIVPVDLKSESAPKWALLRTPNNNAFFDEIGAQRWRKTYPYLRQQILPVSAYLHKQQLLKFTSAVLVDFPARTTEVWEPKMVEHIHLENFTIAQEIPGHSIQESVGRYENLFEKHRVDMIRCDYAAYAEIHNLRILNSGRHPLVLENSFGIHASDLTINGAWNKGKKGNGYVRFARTYNSSLRRSSIKNIRHITLQWSSANNLLENLDIEVDINFHGGYAHDNSVRDIRINLSDAHLWEPVTFTPLNAQYAPPDGPRNTVERIQANR